MSNSRRSSSRLFRLSAVPTLALAVVAGLPLATAHQAPAGTGWTPMTPVSLTYTANAPGKTAYGNLIAFNDFHGAIDPPTGSGGLINGTPAGGSEYLTTWVKKLRTEAQASGEQSLTVAAGDLIGASPLVSAGFHDEPAIEIMNNLGLDLSSVGNHEFDEGTTELRRMQFGGCHPTDGCQDGDGFAGAKFPYLAANVLDKKTHLPFLLPVSIKLVGGVPVGFVGMTLKGTPGIVNPAGVTSVEFKDEIETANFYASALKLLGVKSLVLLIHQGGAQSVSTDVSSCVGFAGDITPIVAGLDPAYGIVVSGHTHRFYSCALPNKAGQNVVVTSAGSNGQLLTDISYTLDKKTGRFASVEAHNVIVENGVRNPDGSWQFVNGVPVRNPDLVDPSAKVIADKYRTAIASLANKVIGKITSDLSSAALPNGESPIGDVIADAQLAYTATSAGAQIAFMNPGGIRASLSYAASVGGEAPGEVTYGECFTVQPFNNLVVTQTFTGAQIKEVLEQQFAGYAGQGTTRILQVSKGFTYTYTASAALGSRISDVKLNGVALDPAANYQVTTNDFLANGGDGFTNLKLGAGRTTAPGFDVDALTAYIAGNSPVAPGTADRITKVA
ncbi:bifunctional metallophosphatase/5'-nucleotidase [Hamadaea tsunoensis]|uniref:bifunctional metallophosphatase/5'-nucleotidase n=1 Tax=Hamadaea tsunoensis TaxID=53368 RepID=UPI000415BC05|nr:bifunctional metallophosphatase/5'-nucleotidase [Hamadaea tsunoensis]